MADTHVELAEWIELSGFPGVRAKNLKTGIGGLVQLSKFLGAVVAGHLDNRAAKGVKEITGATALVRLLAIRMKEHADEADAQMTTDIHAIDGPKTPAKKLAGDALDALTKKGNVDPNIAKRRKKVGTKDGTTKP